MLWERFIDVLEFYYDMWFLVCFLLEFVKLEEIDGFFVRNNEEYLVLIFEKGGFYLGREVVLDLF